MTSARSKSAYLWLAIAVMAVATVVHAEPAGAGAKPYVHPVLEFLAGHQTSSAPAGYGKPQLLNGWSGQHAASAAQGQGLDLLLTMLPVFFIGLAAPLSLVSFQSIRLSSRVPAAPAPSSAFQRPPPVLLA